MSVLTPLPPQRPDVEAPLVRHEAPRPTHRRRTIALVAGGVVVLALAGGTAYYVAQDDATPAASTSVGLPFTSTEAERDAAMARRAPDDGLRATEAQRDAAYALRGPVTVTVSGFDLDAVLKTEAMRDAAWASRWLTR
jgi:hypothetical protein